MDSDFGEQRRFRSLEHRSRGQISKLGGETDVAILPRAVGSPIPASVAAVEFCREAREFPSGVAAFDAAYEVLVRPGQMSRPPVEALLAENILHRPADRPGSHSLLAWRDPFGFHCHARLPAPPNWATVSWLLGVAEDCMARLLDRRP